MKKQKKSSAPSTYPGSVPMFSIDGEKIRRIRESKGLTQLYLSTVVGVTTDTISRWENRRYPSIKLENAQKLALALEVELTELLEQEETGVTEDKKTDRKIQKSPFQKQPYQSRLLRYNIGFSLLFLACVLFFFFFRSEKPSITVKATRSLPTHVAPGQPFPVLIEVKTREQVPVTFILKESVPAGSRPVPGAPPFTVTDPETNSVRWIARTESGRHRFAYIVQSPDGLATQTGLKFGGTVTLKQITKKQWPVGGDTALTIAPFHWADSNKDNIIDDEEILAVYEVYSDTDELRLDLDLIDSIWSGSGYAWDAENKTYKIGY